MQYRCHLVNFGYAKYMGPSLDQARAAAVATGFECAIYADQQLILSWSPIQGWREFVA